MLGRDDLCPVTFYILRVTYSMFSSLATAREQQLFSAIWNDFKHYFYIVTYVIFSSLATRAHQSFAAIWEDMLKLLFTF
jgi:hypothetical protein